MHRSFPVHGSALPSPSPRPLSLAALRRHVVAWQRFATRFRRASPEDVVACVARLGCVQLDSIATVERSHLIVLASRAGATPPAMVSTLLGEGRLFEYWAHEACLLDIGAWPLYRGQMAASRSHRWWGPVIDSDPALASRVVSEIRERGPLGSRHFEGRGGAGMWNVKPAKRMLDALWTAGELVVSGRQGFQRLYDLPERVLPPDVREAVPLEGQALLRALVERAVRSRGALTRRGVMEHARLRGGLARIDTAIRELLRDGVLRELAVEDGGAPVLLPGDVEVEDATPPRSGVLLSPFENMLWDRAFVRRVFGFDHLIEVYKRPHEREHGYYVLPFLMGDRLVGRADLKSDRDAGVLMVRAFHVERGVRRTTALLGAFARALERLARGLGLDEVDPLHRSPS